MLIWRSNNEFQVFATTANCPADYNDRNRTCAHGYLPDDPGDVANEVGKLAVRDRAHASVIWYSLCNEVRAPFPSGMQQLTILNYVGIVQM